MRPTSSTRFGSIPRAANCAASAPRAPALLRPPALITIVPPSTARNTSDHKSMLCGVTFARLLNDANSGRPDASMPVRPLQLRFKQRARAQFRKVMKHQQQVAVDSMRRRPGGDGAADSCDRFVDATLILVRNCEVVQRVAMGRIAPQRGFEPGDRLVGPAEHELSFVRGCRAVAGNLPLSTRDPFRFPRQGFSLSGPGRSGERNAGLIRAPAVIPVPIPERVVILKICYMLLGSTSLVRGLWSLMPALRVRSPTPARNCLRTY